jgi:hypothetical protein
MRALYRALQEQEPAAAQHAIAQVLEQLWAAAAPMQLTEIDDLPLHGHGVQHPPEAGNVGYAGAMH